MLGHSIAPLTSGERRRSRDLPRLLGSHQPPDKLSLLRLHLAHPPHLGTAPRPLRTAVQPERVHLHAAAWGLRQWLDGRGTGLLQVGWAQHI